jgi:hypothetical protein
MAQPASDLGLEALGVPLWMLGAQVAREHAPGGTEHPVGDRQALGARLPGEDPGRVVVDDLDDGASMRGARTGAGRHDGLIIWPGLESRRALPEDIFAPDLTDVTGRSNTD